MMNTPWYLYVLIPAHNEEALLPRCLRSVLTACAVLPASCHYEIIVVSDASTDQTASLAKMILKGKGLVVKSDKMNVGEARRLAARTAISRFADNPARCWLANTDADCQVPDHWLTSQLARAANGVQAITGIINVDSFEEHAPHVPERFRQTYLLGADGSHSHVHGANLGVRMDAYLKAGEWSGLKTGEDHDLWRRLILQGSVTLSDTGLCVLTSGRRIGRAPQGFADRLAAHNG